MQLLGSASTGHVVSSVNATSLALTVSHTQPAGSNRVMTVGVNTFWDSPVTVAEMSIAVTYNGIALTQVDTTGFDYAADAGQRIALFELKEASLPSDGAHNVVITLTRSGAATTAPRDVTAVCRTWGDVDQVTTRRTGVKVADTNPQTGTSTGPATTVVDDVLIDVLGTFTGTRTIGAGQSVVGTHDTGDTDSDVHMSYEVATGTSTTASWTFTSQEYAHLAVPYIPAAGGGGSAPGDEDAYVPGAIPALGPVVTVY